MLVLCNLFLLSELKPNPCSKHEASILHNEYISTSLRISSKLTIVFENN